MGQIALSKRMQAVADMVSSGNRVCDVGCDHGYISIYLLQSGRSPSAIAMDVRKGPLLGAKEHVHRYGLEKYIELRLSDGLSAYEAGEADTFLCAGVGGRLLMNILLCEEEKAGDFKELVLQPQSEIPAFRKFLRERGYLFVKEDMVLEEGKFYPVMKVKPAREADSLSSLKYRAKNKEDTESFGERAEDAFGPLLLRERHPVLLQFIEKEIVLKTKILNRLQGQQANERNAARTREVEEELALLKNVKARWRV